MELSNLGVSEKKEKQFRRAGITNIEDLLMYFPRKYQDFTKITGIMPPDEMSCIIVDVNQVIYKNGRNQDYILATCVTEDGHDMTIMWFHCNYKYYELCKAAGKRMLVAGKIKPDRYSKNYTLAMPEIFEEVTEKAFSVRPVYSKIQGMSDDYLREKIKKAVDKYLYLVKEPMPMELVRSMNLMSESEAVYSLHFPESVAMAEKARFRISYDAMQLYALRTEMGIRKSPRGSAFGISSLKLFNQIRELLPYDLTEDQAESCREMIRFVKEGKRINALVQGDVGCGKTTVAFLMMAAFSGSGYQSVLMAPTQVLARQHYEELRDLVEPIGFHVAFLASDMKAAEIRKAKKEIASGEAQFIVGTHSVIGKSVEYNNLALAVIDEEHKFGVAQRNAITERTSAGVHTITMSATPIPRSIAKAIYGDTVQLHTIKTMPGKRKPVTTGLVNRNDPKSLGQLFRYIIGCASKGHQTYVVCPLIDTNEKLEGVMSVRETSDFFRKYLEPYGVMVGELTGKDSKKKVDETIEKFRNNEISVLVSTTVVEVGVNVPSATLMVINNAERFGLSSLHQLRGRVGRGDTQSFCALMIGHETEKAVKRLNIMCQTTDGFKIAEEDLKLRGTGDLLGTRQSGDNADVELVMKYPEIYEKAQKFAGMLLDSTTPCKMVEEAEAEEA